MCCKTEDPGSRLNRNIATVCHSLTDGSLVWLHEHRLSGYEMGKIEAGGTNLPSLTVGVPKQGALVDGVYYEHYPFSHLTPNRDEHADTLDQATGETVARLDTDSDISGVWENRVGVLYCGGNARARNGGTDNGSGGTEGVNFARVDMTADPPAIAWSIDTSGESFTDSGWQYALPNYQTYVVGDTVVKTGSATVRVSDSFTFQDWTQRQVWVEGDPQWTRPITEDATFTGFEWLTFYTFIAAPADESTIVGFGKVTDGTRGLDSYPFGHRGWSIQDVFGLFEVASDGDAADFHRTILTADDWDEEEVEYDRIVYPVESTAQGVFAYYRTRDYAGYTDPHYRSPTVLCTVQSATALTELGTICTLATPIRVEFSGAGAGVAMLASVYMQSGTGNEFTASLWIAKFSSGSVEWITQIDGAPANCRESGLGIGPDGNVYLTFYAGDLQTNLVSLDGTDGSHRWTVKSVGLSDSVIEQTQTDLHFGSEGVILSGHGFQATPVFPQSWELGTQHTPYTFSTIDTEDCTGSPEPGDCDGECDGPCEWIWIDCQANASAYRRCYWEAAAGGGDPYVDGAWELHETGGAVPEEVAECLEGCNCDGYAPPGSEFNPLELPPYECDSGNFWLPIDGAEDNTTRPEGVGLYGGEVRKGVCK
jgi:hypothetical protein